MQFLFFKLLYRSPIKAILSSVLLFTSTVIFCLGILLYNSAATTKEKIEDSFITIVLPDFEHIIRDSGVERGYPYYSRLFSDEEVMQWGISDEELAQTLYGIGQQIKHYNWYEKVIVDITSNDDIMMDDRRMYLGAISVDTVHDEIEKTNEIQIGINTNKIEETQTNRYSQSSMLNNILVLDVTITAFDDVSEDVVDVDGNILWTDSYMRWTADINEVLVSGFNFDASEVNLVYRWGEVMQVGYRYIVLIDSFIDYNENLFIAHSINRSGQLVYKDDNIPDDMSSPATRLTTDIRLRFDSIDELITSSGMSPELAHVWYDIVIACRNIVTMVPIMTTNDLNFIPVFNTNQSHIVEGRALTTEDSSLNANVCVISTDFADKSGLSIGDRLSIKISDIVEYNYILGIDGNTWDLRVPSPLLYTLDYENIWEIIGIYQSTEITNMNQGYFFSPDTIIISAGSMPLTPLDKERLDNPLYASSSAWGYPDVLKTWYIPSSKAESFVNNLDPDTASSVLLIDQGYSYISSLLDTIYSNALTILLITAVIWILTILLFLYIQIDRSKVAIGILRSLGFNKSIILKLYGAICLCIWLLSAGVLFVLTHNLYNNVVERMYTYVIESHHFDESYSDLGTWANQGTNLFTGEVDSTTAEQLISDVRISVNTDKIIIITLVTLTTFFIIITFIYLFLLVNKNPLKLIK